jgi:hypothetical protein
VEVEESSSVVEVEESMLVEVDEELDELEELDGLVLEVEDVGGGGMIGVSPSARDKKAAIWPRLTKSSGQNRSLTGGLQPWVMPAVPSRSMASSKIELSSSTNRFPPPSSVSPRARVRNPATPCSGRRLTHCERWRAVPSWLTAPHPRRCKGREQAARREAKWRCAGFAS